MTLQDTPCKDLGSLAPIAGSLFENRFLMATEQEAISSRLPEGWSIEGATIGKIPPFDVFGKIIRHGQAVILLQSAADVLLVECRVAGLETRHVERIVAVLRKAVEDVAALRFERDLPAASPALISEIEALDLAPDANAPAHRVLRTAMVGTPASIRRDAYLRGPDEREFLLRTLQEGEILVEKTSGSFDEPFTVNRMTMLRDGHLVEVKRSELLQFDPEAVAPEHEM